MKQPRMIIRRSKAIPDWKLSCKSLLSPRNLSIFGGTISAAVLGGFIFLGSGSQTSLFDKILNKKSAPTTQISTPASQQSTEVQQPNENHTGSPENKSTEAVIEQHTPSVNSYSEPATPVTAQPQVAAESIISDTQNALDQNLEQIKQQVTLP